MNLPLTAAVLIIGNEILCGQTLDTNSQRLARFLAGRGIDLMEIRTVGDDMAAIAGAVQALKSHYRYVLTTGGIGPTHDDVTAEAVAAAFGVPVEIDSQALEMQQPFSDATREFHNSARRMARIPKGASLIKNPLTGAPGFQIGNVIVLAGVPTILMAMLEDVRLRLGLRPEKQSVAVAGKIREGKVASAVARLAEQRPDLEIGCYPGVDAMGEACTRLVARSRDPEALTDIADSFTNIFLFAGAEILPPPKP